MAARRRRLAAAIGAAGLAVLLATAGCSSSGGQSGSDSAAGPGLIEDGAADGAAARDDSAADAAGAPGKPGTAAGTAADVRIEQRAIIYTGSITVRVDDVDAAAARATSIVTGAGGFVGGDRRSSDAEDAEATLELRVPADRFIAVVEELADLGRPERREINTEDVTEQTLDLDARIATQQARVESGRRLLAQAKNLSDLILLESELAKREADLASLEAKKRRLADLTALSTITAVLLGPQAKEADDEPATGFLAGLRGGWTAFVASVRILLTVLGALLPFVIAVGVPVFLIVRLSRRLRRRTGAAASPAAVPAGGLPATGPMAAYPAYPSPASTTPPTPTAPAPASPTADPAPAPAPRTGGS